MMTLLAVCDLFHALLKLRMDICALNVGEEMRKLLVSLASAAGVTCAPFQVLANSTGAPLNIGSVYNTTIRPQLAEAEYLKRLKGVFNLQDLDGDGIITPVEIKRLHDQMIASRRASSIGELLRKDSNGDGIVTVTEIRDHYDLRRMRLPRPLREEEVAKFSSRDELLMKAESAADLNGDGRITVPEMSTHSDNVLRSQPAMPQYQMTLFDPAPKTTLGVKWEDVRITGSAYFAGLDKDGSGILTADETREVAANVHYNGPAPALRPADTNRSGITPSAQPVSGTCSNQPLRPIARTRTQPLLPPDIKPDEQGQTTLEVKIGVDGVPIHALTVSSTASLRVSEIARAHVQTYWRWQAPTLNCERIVVTTRVQVLTRVAGPAP